MSKRNPTRRERRLRDERIRRRNYQIAVDRRKPVVSFRRMVRDRILARTVPRPIYRVYRVRKQYKRQQIGTRPKPQRIGSVLRLVVHPSDCTRRKNFKKTMMKKLAAQVARKAGAGGVTRWRRRLSRENPKTRNPC